MKKIIILALCLALAQFSLQAQTFNWGIKLGLSTPDVKQRFFEPRCGIHIFLEVDVGSNSEATISDVVITRFTPATDNIIIRWLKVNG